MKNTLMTPVLVTGGRPQDDPDCPICAVVARSELTGLDPTMEELDAAFAEAKRLGHHV